MTILTAKERPILFSGPMVRAILDGRKRQTRRVVISGAKSMQESGQVCVKRNPDNDPWYKEYVWSVRGRGGLWNDYTDAQMLARCPYGTAGDRLWVRETFVFRSKHNRYYYRADHSEPFTEPYAHGGWKPSIFMPRAACRIMLEVTKVRIEQVNEISHEDAVAEGCYRIEPCAAYPNGNAWGRAGFAAFWDKINKARGFGWDTKPWVWAIDFQQVNTN